MLVVTVPAGDLTLLTQEERRAAAGLAGDDTSQDVVLEALDARVAASIAAECNVAIGQGANPTLRRETLTETFFGRCGDMVRLSRRHEIEVTSISVDGQAVASEDFMVDPEAGFLTRLEDGYPRRWYGRKIVVVYDAGFDEPPADLKQAATDCFRSFYLEQNRDPLVKSERVKIDDVEEVERQYWVGSAPGQSSEGAIPDAVAGQLKRFRNVAVG